jgi:hypothetical protein
LAPLPILLFADSQSLGVSVGIYIVIGIEVWSDQSMKFACVKADGVFYEWGQMKFWNFGAVMLWP